MPKGGRKSKGKDKGEEYFESPKAQSSKGKGKRDESPEGPPQTPKGAPPQVVSKTPFDEKHWQSLRVEKHRVPVWPVFPPVENAFKPGVKRALSEHSRKVIDAMVEDSNKRRELFDEFATSAPSRKATEELDDHLFELFKRKTGILELDTEIARLYLDFLYAERDEDTECLGGCSAGAVAAEIIRVQKFISNHLEGTNIYKATAASAIKEWRASNTLRDECDNDILAYVDMVVQREKPPLGATIDFKKTKEVDDQRPDFRTRAFRNYDALHTVHGVEQAWCPIIRDFLPKANVVAAHMAPTSYSESLQQYFFGDGETNHMFDSKNCVLMCKHFELLLDHGAIVLVPGSPSDDDPEVPEEERWKVIVLTSKFEPFTYIKDGKTHVFDAKKLHGRLLRFRNNFRPGKRYVWCRYALNMLRRKRYEAKGWEKDVQYYGQYWGTPGMYTRKSTLLTLARCIGHTTDLAGLEKFAMDVKGDKNKDQEIANAVESSLFPPSRHPSGVLDYGGDDEEEDLTESLGGVSLGKEGKGKGKS